MAKFMAFTGTVMKNLFSKPVTTSYPAEPAVYPERTRGHVENDIDKCVLCSLCAKSCPPGAIEVDRANNKWSINRYDCIQCGYCVEVCPKKSLSIIPGYQAPGPKKEMAVLDKPVPETPQGGAAAGGKPKADLNTCVFCTLCAKKCPQEALEVDRASKSWKLNEEKCIECGLCATNCPKKCITMGGGSAAAAAPAGKPKADKDTCVFCTLCAKKCPQEAITVDRESKTWELDEEKCIECGLCASNCPKKCIKM